MGQAPYPKNDAPMGAAIRRKEWTSFIGQPKSFPGTKGNLPSPRPPISAAHGSCLAAIQTVNTKFFSLKSKRKENHDLTLELTVRIESYEKWKKYQKHYRAWEKLPEAKRGDFERRYEYELHQYRQAAAALHRWQTDGEKIDYKGWKAALDYLNKEQFMLDYQLQEMKEKVRRMEVVKREFIQENKQTTPERYAW